MLFLFFHSGKTWLDKLNVFLLPSSTNYGFRFHVLIYVQSKSDG